MSKAPTKGSLKSKKSKLAPKTHVPASPFERFEQNDLRAIMNTSETDNYVWLALKLTDWDFADFTICIRASSTLSTLRRHIMEKHGHAPRLQLFRPPVNKKNELMDFSLTLENVGIMGGPKDAHMKAELYYSFKPIKGDPIVLREPGMHIPDDHFSSSGSTVMDERTRSDATPL